MVSQQSGYSDDFVKRPANIRSNLPPPGLAPISTRPPPPRGSSLSRNVTPPPPSARSRRARPDQFPHPYPYSSNAPPAPRPPMRHPPGGEDRVPPLPFENGAPFYRTTRPQHSPNHVLKTSTSMPNVRGRRYQVFPADRSPMRASPAPPIVTRPLHHHHSPELHLDSPGRTSSQSAMTGNSSIEPASGTERSSVATKSSTVTEASPDTPEDDGGMSVDDAINMYLDGFMDDPPKELDWNGGEKKKDKEVEEDTSSRSSQGDDIKLIEAALETQDKKSEPAPKGLPPLPAQNPPENTQPKLAGIPADTHPPALVPVTKLRDQYGFHKSTPHITVDQFDAWHDPYSRYMDLRRQKWLALLRDGGISETDPATFPPRSNKIKRFIRKGIPPEFRGAAWFWYAGGHEHMRNNPGLYQRLVETAQNTPMDDDKEHIERDLHRTFPDNIHFKPDPTDQSETPPGSGSSNLRYGSDNPETPIIQTLRRVLYAFSKHNPKIGYTQSLNFIAGLLLLFLPEERAFWMLHIITSEILPGTHEISLEGANADLWILMIVLKEALPVAYTKVASSSPTTPKSRPPAITTSTRLPDITLGLTNWLMSMFISSLPFESTLRVWDVLFYEGSRTFFRVALSIFRLSQREIYALSDPMEIFQIVQTAPKKTLDANMLMNECFARRFRMSQARVESLRIDRRQAIRQDKERLSLLAGPGKVRTDVDGRPSTGATSPLPGAWRSLKNHTFR